MESKFLGKMGKAGEVPVQPTASQRLKFDDGYLDVTNSFTAPEGLLHRTVDGGYYFGPGKPLTSDEVASLLPEPYHEEAHAFIAAQTPPPPPEGGALDAPTTEETPSETPSESPGYSRRRR